MGLSGLAFDSNGVLHISDGKGYHIRSYLPP
jgi:hypothetical protein